MQFYQNNFKKNHQSDYSLFLQRLTWAYLVIVLLALILMARLFELQVIDHQKYTTLSNKNQLNTIPIEPTRGVIYDRNGLILAENVPAYNLELIPDKIHSIPTAIVSLQKLIPSIQPEDIQAFYKLKKQRHSFDSIALKLSLTPEEVAQFSVNQYRFPGVAIRAHLIRHYPLNQLMVHVLGYVGRINSEEWSRLDRVNYSATDFIGKIGIEKHYEALLHGTVGYEQAEINAGGRVVRALSKTPPIPGSDIYLSIDARLQQAADDALGDNRGSVIVLNPSNGDVLAMVSKPSYDPNPFVQGIHQKAFDVLRLSSDQPLYNRAIRGQYPPGSTVKPFMALAGLDENIVDLHYKIFDPGWFKLPNSTHHYRDWKKGGHGWVDLQHAIAYSCDTYFFNLGNLMGINRMSQFLNRVGFGKKTGIDVDEELPGLVPTPDWKHSRKGVSWYPGDTVITAIGQGYLLATPMQLATGVAAISQHGTRFKPHLLLRYKTDKKITSFLPEQSQPVVLHYPTTWDAIIQGMQMVFTVPHGTGSTFGHIPYSIAGKTGTAQVFTVKQSDDPHNEHLPKSLRDHALFIAFAPVENPQIAIAVLVENNGEHFAPKVARQVMDAWLLNYNKISAT